MNDFALKEISEAVKLIISEIKQPEYITLEEVLQVTGLSEKTIRDHLRNKVTSIGRNAWDRKKFFDYWKNQFEEKQIEYATKTARTKEILENIIDYHKRR